MTHLTPTVRKGGDIKEDDEEYEGFEICHLLEASYFFKNRNNNIY